MAVLIPAAARTKLVANGRRSHLDAYDPAPVVKLFTPDANATWLLYDIDPEDPDRAYALCDLGLGYPEMGPVSLAEIAAIRGRFRLPVERDLYFHSDAPISAWANAARAASRIVEPTPLDLASSHLQASQQPTTLKPESSPMIVSVYHHDFPLAPADLTLVARVAAPAETTDAALEYAWRAIQNIDGSWSRGPRLSDGSPNGDYRPEIEVVAPLPVIDGKVFGLRSSMVGDVFEIDGRRFRVANLGFDEIVAA